MSYAPSTFNDCEYFFRQEGFIASDAVQLYGPSYSWPAASASYGTAVVLTDSLMHGGGGAYWWNGWDLTGAPYDKVLATLYWHNYQDSISGVYIGANALDGLADAKNYYSAGFDSLDKCGLRKAGALAGNGSLVAAQATIYPDPSSSFARSNSPAWGLGLYCEANIQKVFVRSSTSNWAQVISETDGDHTTFSSVSVRGYATGKQILTPFNVWVS
jgi:hypothetical protein